MDELKTYIKSMAAQSAGNAVEAERLLCESLHLTEPTSYMKQNLKRLVDINNPNDAVLTLVTRDRRS